jgi:hypothetical protein
MLCMLLLKAENNALNAISNKSDLYLNSFWHSKMESKNLGDNFEWKYWVEKFKYKIWGRIKIGWYRLTREIGNSYKKISDTEMDILEKNEKFPIWPKMDQTKLPFPICPKMDK